jgi:predicted methyltransferase
VLAPQVSPDQSPSPLTVGVFEYASRLYELVWKEYYRGSYLSAYIGKNGRNLRKAIVLAEVARLQKLHGFTYRVHVSVDESITITIEREQDG